MLRLNEPETLKINMSGGIMAEKKKTTKKSAAAPAKRAAAKTVRPADKKTAAKTSKPPLKKGAAKTIKAKPKISAAPAKKSAPVSPKREVKKSPAKKHQDDTSIITEAVKNIETGAKTVSKYASVVAKDVADRTTKVAEDVLKKTKKGISEVYDKGSKAVEDAQQAALEYIDRYKNSVEMRKESAKRVQLTTKLGDLVYSKYQNKKISAEKLFKDEKLMNLINQIQTINKKIVKIGKKLEKK